MTVPTSDYIIKYRGSGKTNEVFYIPFGFGSLSDIRVVAYDAELKATVKVPITHYNVTAATSDGTNTVISGVPADYGWITWVGSTTDLIHIFRDGEIVFDVDWGTEGVDTKSFEEKGLDRITEAMPRYLKRSETDPTHFDALNRKIQTLFKPYYPDDAATFDQLEDYEDAATGPSLPSHSSSNEDDILTSRRSIPSTPPVGQVRWQSVREVPSSSGTNAEVLTSGSGSGWSFDVKRWIPAAPDDGAGSFLWVDQAEAMSWAKVWETPVTGSGGAGDVLSLQPIDIPTWTTIREAIAPAAWSLLISNGRHIVKRSTTGNVSFGPRYTFGTKQISLNCISMGMGGGGMPGHGGNGFFGTGGQEAWEVDHGMINNSGASVAPTRVFLMLETQKYNEKDAGYQYDVLPIFVARLNKFDSSSDSGVTSTKLQGRIACCNANDGQLQGIGVANPIYRRTIALGSFAPSTDPYILKIHFLAVLD